jgi:hypothetical protein
MRKIPFMIIFIALLIGVLRFSVRAQTNAAAAEIASASEKEGGGQYYLPVVVMHLPPHWRPVAAKQIPVETITKFFDIAACGEHLFGGTNEGLYRLDRAKREWTKVTQDDFPGDLIVAGVTFRDATCDTVYAVARGEGLWLGQQNNKGEWIWDRVDDPKVIDEDARYVLVTEKTIFLAGDFGVRWAQIPDDQAAYTWQDTNLKSLVTTISNNDGRLLAAVWNEGVFEWNDQSKKFDKLAGTLPDTQIYAASSIDSDIIAGAQSGLIRADTAVPWYVVKTVPVETTFATLAHKGTFLIGQRYQTAFRSDDGGQTWKALPVFPDPSEDGDQGFQVRGFDIDLTDGQLYAATTSGVWRLVDNIP